MAKKLYFDFNGQAKDLTPGSYGFYADPGYPVEMFDRPESKRAGIFGKYQSRSGLHALADFLFSYYFYIRRFNSHGRG
jgi:hypothetical protein